MPYHEVKDPFQTAQDVLFEQLRKAGAEKQRREREQEQYQSTQDYLREQVQNYNNGVDPTDNESGYGTEKTNRDVQDSMNEKLADKGIKVDNVDTKHVSDETQDMTLANRPTTDDKVKDSMNEKLADKGITVNNVNTKPVSNAEHVTMDRTQSKTDIAGTGTATTAGQTDKKFSVSTQPKPTDSPLGDMETMGKMKTNTSTSTNSTSLDTPSVESSVPKSNVRPTNETATPKTETTKEQNESIQKSMNEKLSDKGIKVGEVNSGATAGKEVNLVKNVTPPKTEQKKRFKDDSGYVTKTVPNEPSATIVQKDAGTAKGAVGESFSGTKTTELPKNNVNADKAGLIGLKNSKSFKK